MIMRAIKIMKPNGLQALFQFSVPPAGSTPSVHRKRGVVW